jgi:hypothetical protein
MHLATTVAQEAKVDPQSVMLLRHGNGKTASLLREGGALEEYTLVQVTDSKYDFLATGRPPIAIVVAIVNDRVHFVYRIQGIERHGTTRSLTSAGFNRFDIAAGFPALPARRFSAKSVLSRTIGCVASGWNSPRNAVARYGSKTFDAVTCM